MLELVGILMWQTVLPGLVTNRMDAGVCRALVGIRKKLWKPSPENHDLQKALLEALRNGIETAARRGLKSLEKNKKSQVEYWLKQQLHLITQEITSVKQGKGSKIGLDEDWGLLLRATPDELQAMSQRQVNSHLRQLKEKLEQHLQVHTLPDGFREGFQSEWLPWVNLYLSEAVKTNQRVAEILEVNLLLDIQSGIQQLIDVLSNPQQVLGAIQLIDFDIAELRTELTDWQKILTGHLEGLKEQIEASASETQQQFERTQQQIGLGFDETQRQLDEVLEVLLRAEKGSTQTVSANLITIPPKAECWQGRNQESVLLIEWLSDPLISLIGIQGISGVGKSSLAAQIFEQAKDLEFSFVGTFWADVSQQPDFTIFAEQALKALGSDKRLTVREVTELTNELINCLNNNRCLLVMDNLETLLTDERLWRDAAYEEFFRRWQQQGRTSVVLVTTQEKPATFKTNSWISLQGLGADVGEELLTSLGIVGSAEELRTFAASLDGHPLTLKLVAGFLQEYCHGQIAQARELGLEAFDQIVDAAVGQHRNNREVRRAWILQQHLDRLGDHLRCFLLNVSVYRHGFDLPAAAVMYVEEQDEVSLIEVKQALQELVNRSLLIELGDNNYQFQAFIATYIGQQAITNVLGHAKAIEYWQSICVDSEQWQSLQDLAPKLEISYHQCQQQEWAAAAKTLLSCCSFLLKYGHSSLLIELARPIVDEFETQASLTPEDEHTLAVIYGHLAEALDNTSDFRKSLAYEEKQLRIAQKLQDKRLEALTLAGIGESQSYLGQIRHALASYQQSLELSQEFSDPDIQVRALIGMSISQIDLGEWSSALESLRQALSLAESSDPSLKARALNRLGILEVGTGQVQQGYAKCEQALEIAQSIGDQRTELRVLRNLSQQRNQVDSLQKAHDRLKTALKIAQDSQDLYQEIAITLAMVTLHSSIPIVDDVERQLQKALKLSREIGARQQEASALTALGQFSITQNEP